MIHELKAWPIPFQAVKAGDKKHEVRVFDRNYAVGDNLLLREWNQADRAFTGESLLVRVTHITEPGTWGLPPTVGVMSIEPAL
jgi:ASC-1-like (ASCH) protein